MRADIIVVSDSDKHFGSAIDEYVKRMGDMVTIHILKPVKHGSVDQIRTKETDLLRDKIIQVTEKNECMTVLLSHRGKSMISEKFAEIVRESPRMVFVIGGPYGVKEPVLEPLISKKICFGQLTMPHGLVKLVLLEQLRRAHTILINKKYHY